MKQIFCSSVQEVRNLVMHGHETGFSHFLITEVDSMGGVVDFGVGLDIKTSPRRAVIAKAQEELRLEYDVREERKRELEFLEKGGNPLDFKLGRAASISLQSTSFTDQPVENETKRSFALPSSPLGDSAESSGHPGGSICQEPNIADNLVLFGSGKSNTGGEKSVKRTGKRTNLNSLEKSSQIDAQRNLKDSSESLISRLGANGQAYARRNRSRSSRDNHSNKCLSDFRDAKGLQRGVHAEEHAVSSMSNSKSDIPVKDSSITYVSEREMDVDKTENMSSDNTKGFANVVATTISEKVQVIEHDVAPVEQATCSSATQPSQLIALDASSVAFPSAAPVAIENTSSSHLVARENDCNVSDVDLIDLHDNYMNGKRHVSDTSALVGEKNINMDPAHLMTRFPNGNVVADDSLVLRTDTSREEETCRRPSTCSILTERIQSAGSVVHTGIDKSICLPANLSSSVVHVKVEKVPFVVDDDNIKEKSLPNIKCAEARKSDNYLGDSFHAINTAVVTSSTEDPSLTIAKTVSSIVPNLQNREAVQAKLSKKDHESAVLSEARIIEANLKRADALPKSSLSTEKRHKCHWDYVLEEMAWMANDFMQERIWKRSAAAQVCQLIASVGRSKFEQELMFREQKTIARTLAKAVMQFWRSTKAIHAKGGTTSSKNKDCEGDPCDLSNANGFDIMKDQGVENHGQFLPLGIQSYALRFLNYISTTLNDPVMTEAMCTTKRVNGAVILESVDDQHSGESLFYKVPPGAMLAYRESVESKWANYKKMGNTVCREDCEASLCGSIADGHRESAFEEDEGETGPGIVQGTFEGNFSFKLSSTKKKKLQQRLYTQTFYEGGHDSSYGPYPVGKSSNQSLPSIGKRPSSTINVGMAPTKRTRTAARQRIINPFGTGITGVLQMTSRTDGSSGDTSSFQDDQCSLHGDSQLWKHLEVESTADFERRLPYVGIERSSKSKKRRKSKQLGYKGSLNLDDSGVMTVSRKGSTYEHRLHADFMMQQDQRDLMEKRSESQPFEPNGNPGFYGQHVAKKTKFMKHADCNEQIALAGGAIISPVASQMSNMSNSNKLIRIMNHRDRGRKSKVMKVAAGQSGSGSAWSSFEDQALVVLVHDMGLNWELVSDALSSTLLFKCIYRKPDDCKERHKFLMDRSAGDGADSAEDSGSSQPYQSTLPGIPKGSARQLFQRLHGPMEEDTLKSRFEKIILIGQRLHSCRIQSDHQDPKQITLAHGSHVLSLSQAFPNNLAGAILSPLDLCDAVTSNPDVNNLGCHGSYSTGIAVASHQGSLAPVLSNSCSSTILLGNGLSSSPSVNISPRDAQRYAIPRSANLLVDDQQRLQNCSQIFSGRNMQQNGILAVATSPGVVDCGVRMLHGSNGTGALSGTNRSVSMSRSGFQGINPSGMLNIASTNNLLPVSSVGMPNPVSAHSSVISGPGNTLVRAREGMQMVRPAQSSEEHKQTLMQDIQLQASQGNTQVVTQQLSGTSIPFCNAAVCPPIQTLPVQQQQQPHQIPHILGSSHPSHILSSDHSSTSQHPYLRFSKERQQQRTIPSTQTTVHNSQLQQQSQPASVNLTSSSQLQQKQQPIPRNPQSNGAMSTQIMKQRQRHQVEQQQPRSMQQQKQPQQHAKHLKSLGRGSVLIHPNLPADGSHFTGLQVAPKTQSSEKHLVQQSQVPFSGNAGISPSFQHANPHKLYSRPPVQLSKHAPLGSSLPDNKQPSMQAPPIHAVASHQSVPSSIPLPAQQQLRQANQSPPNMQRMALQQNHHLKPDGQLQSSSELVQVKQMVPVASVSQTTDSISPPLTLPSGNHWKQDPSMERNASSHENLSGNNAVKVSSRQLSGTMSILGHVAGGQWQQQQNSKTQSSLPSLQQNQQGVQGNIHTRPLNAEPG